MAANDHIKSMKNVTILEHPLYKHKISILPGTRPRRHKMSSVRSWKRIAILMGYEVLRRSPTEDGRSKLRSTCTAPMISRRKMAIIPILRAGLGMVSGMLALPVPFRKVRVRTSGMYRDEESP